MGDDGRDGGIIERIGRRWMTRFEMGLSVSTGERKAGDGGAW